MTQDFTRALVLLPVLVGLTQAIKQMVPEKAKNYLWIVNCILGIGLAFLFVSATNTTDLNTAMIVLGGIVLGLAGSGLYEATKGVTKAIKG